MTQEIIILDYIFQVRMHAVKTPLSRFITSMKIDYEKWRDGISYDLEALKQANEQEKETIQQILIKKNPLNWRDIESLALLDTRKARAALKAAVHKDNAEVNMAVIRFAPELINEDFRTKLIIKALKTVRSFEGLSSTLMIVDQYHPKEVVSGLFKGLISREGEVAVHFAAMLLYLYGKTETYYGWEKRSFLLKFNTSERCDRKIVFRELCKQIDVDYTEYLE